MFETNILLRVLRFRFVVLLLCGLKLSGLGLRLEALMFGGLRFPVWRIWGFEVLSFEDSEVLKAFGRTPSCSTSLPGGNQVDGLPPGVH